MKRILLTTIPVITITAVCLLAGYGCGKRPGAVKSAEKTSFDAVTSHLDAGGNFYLYMGTEQLLDGLSAKISNWRQFVASMPDVDADDRENIGKGFDVVTGLIRDSGIEDVSGFGMSVVATGPGFYRSKSFLHHYPGKGNGFLWKMGGGKAHALTGLDLLPQNTAFAIFSDLDVPMLWSVIEKHARQSGFAEARAFLDKVPAEFQRATGLTWETVIRSMGGEFGFAITLDETRMVALPGPAGQPLQIPEPALLLVLKVNDDTVFDRVDRALQETGQEIIRVDQPDLRMRTISVPLPVPIQVRPTLASAGGYLFIASTDATIQAALAVKAGKAPGLKSTEEFERLSQGVPDQGNQFTFLSERFGKTIQGIQQQALSMAARENSAQGEWLKSLLQSGQPALAYTVSANTDEGWLSVGNGNQHPSKLLAVGAVGMLSAIAIPNFVKARQTAQRNGCINNLRQIDGAKQQWALEKGKTENAVPTQAELSEFLNRGFPSCPQGGRYTIGPVNEQPACSTPGHAITEW